MFKIDTDVESIDRKIASTIADASSSSWVKTALQNAMDRDPVDAANDAELVADLLAGRAAAVLGKAAPISVLSGYEVDESGA